MNASDYTAHAAREEERRRIVRWLRDPARAADGCESSDLAWAADMIEAGEHRDAEPGAC